MGHWKSYTTFQISLKAFGGFFGGGHMLILSSSCCRPFHFFFCGSSWCDFSSIKKLKHSRGRYRLLLSCPWKCLWCQQGSTFIDSTVGIFIAIDLLLCFSFLTPPYEGRFSYLAGLVFVSGLCLISKPTGLCVGILGLIIAFVLGFRYLNNPLKRKYFLC